MRISVSNIAWPQELDDAVFPWLAANEVQAIEVAPTRVWPQWSGIQTQTFRRRVEAEGLSISSLQSILFQKPELHLFGSAEVRQQLRDHLKLCADIAAALGARYMVFGGPKNRLRGALAEDEAFAIATELFAQSAADCVERGVCLAFEPNPAFYQCDFATESTTAARLVKAVASPGFVLHLDSACMHLAGEDAAAAIQANRLVLQHFHASEQNLGDFATPAASHAESAAALRSIGYPGWVALEMRTGNPPLPALQQAVKFVVETYG